MVIGKGCGRARELYRGRSHMPPIPAGHQAGPRRGPERGPGHRPGHRPVLSRATDQKRKSVLEPLTARPTSSQARKTAAALPSVFSPVSFTKLSISTSIASTPAPAEGDSPTIFPSSIHQRPHIPVLPATSSHRHGDTRPHILHQSQPYQFPGSSNFFFDKKRLHSIADDRPSIVPS